MSRAFDAIIVGAGQAGPPLAKRLTTAGMKVALVERLFVGGTCINAGCTPTKTLIASAYAAHMARRAGEFGIKLEGPVRVDMRAVKARMASVVHRFRQGIEGSLAALPGFMLYRGQARFEGPRVLNVDGESIAAERIFLNVGARPAVPAIPGVQRVPFLTSTSLIALEELPRHLVIIGGSYVGLEFAQMYRRFGSEVTIIEKMSRLIPREDADVSDTVCSILENDRVAVRLDAECIGFEEGGTAAVRVRLDCKEGAREVVGTHALLAVGRQPNTDDLGLDKAGVAVDRRGYIQVDDTLRTSAPGIWALGECNGRGAFTHTSYDDYEIAAADVLGGAPWKLSDRITAYALFIDPPLGRVGLTEAEARKSSEHVLVGTRPMTSIARAIEKSESQGFMKIVVDGDSGRILGASILGPGGDEAVHCLIDAMYAKAPYTSIRRAVHIHPTVAELIPTVLGELRS